jgi:electron transfer flavoprotein alpha subunit
MTVLCLVEYDPAGPADASLRALTLARDLATSAGGEVAAVLFAANASPAEDAPAEAPRAANSPAEDSPAGDRPAGVLSAGERPAGDSPAGVLSAGERPAANSSAGQSPGADLPLAALAQFGVASAWVVRAGAGYAPAAWARGLAELAVARAAGAVVAAATDRGGEVLAHLGAITAQPVAAGCVSARFVSPGLAELTRHRWGGSLLEDATLEASLALLTVADTVPAAPAPAVAEVAAQSFCPDLEPADLQVRAVESADAGGGASLATARVVVGGGRGVGGPEGFAVLEELAGLLGGTVGVSRVVTSQGWRPHRQQVGQTGTKISPELYLACGISGAIQHMAGCQGAKHIVAVNTDPDAPIIARAEYAVIGDLSQVLPALIAAIRARSAAT